jgi:hypothetical protein
MAADEAAATMRRAHLIIGFIAFVVFLATGQYMDRYLAHLHGMAPGPRLLYRTRHIFILLSSLVHLALGAYVQPLADLVARAVQWTGSIMLTLAPVLFLIGFIYEPQRADLRTPFTHWAADAIVSGVGLHLIARLGSRSGSAAR